MLASVKVTGIYTELLEKTATGKIPFDAEKLEKTKENTMKTIENMYIKEMQQQQKDLSLTKEVNIIENILSNASSAATYLDTMHRNHHK